MVKNQSDDPRCKTNLIIAPTALLDQWKLEIEMKTNNMKCLIYHGIWKSFCLARCFLLTERRHGVPQVRQNLGRSRRF